MRAKVDKVGQDFIRNLQKALEKHLGK
jgi:hypothetical protein